MSDANEYLMSGGVRSATLKNVGDSVVGFINQPPELRQQTDFKTKALKTYRDGSPAMEVRVVLSIPEDALENDEDDGLRALYVKGDMHRAVREAVRAASATGLEVGGKLFVRHSGVKPPTEPGLNGAKLYEAKYRAPEPAVTSMPDEANPDDAFVDPDEIPF